MRLGDAGEQRRPEEVAAIRQVARGLVQLRAFGNAFGSLAAGFLAVWLGVWLGKVL